jgi:hypothetical protein
MIIYYPNNSVLYQRTVSGSNLTETFIDCPPDAIFYFTGSGISTASLSSSQYSVSASWSSQSLSASYVQANNIQLFNATTQTYYTLTISGSVGNETLVIQ